MSEKEFFIKPIFTARLSPEEQQLVQESIIDMFYRYTTKQETELFFPFVLSTRDIKAIAAQVRKQNQPAADADIQLEAERKRTAELELQIKELTKQKEVKELENQVKNLSDDGKAS
ncbi:hypothetical protein [Prolixibacter sp. SD074]|jgi:cell division protein FtsB|uniref:hypothetical protein n=1 Tax=Prolixibacter sp. SD074 TaxID=2652391 RepID=UPI00126F7A8A|nr:hypothetical protein [Prolixibacter sp. SD074]GET30512.1 hypothetical protein SD074_27140 [Prolixibacter sp. SD074]